MTATAATGHVGRSQVSLMFGRDTRYLVAYAFQMITAIGLTPVVTRVLGPANYGEFAADLAILWMLVVTIDLGLDVGISKTYAGADGPSRAKRLMSFALLCIGLIVVTGLASISLWSGLLGFSDRRQAVLVVVWSGIASATLVAMAMLRCLDRFGAFATVSLLQSVGALGAGIVVAFSRTRSPNDVLTGAIFVQAIAFAVGLATTRPRLPRRKDFRWIADAVEFSLPLVPQQVGYLLMISVDRVIVHKYLGAEPTGRYQVAYNVGAMAILLMTFMNQAWLPRVFAISDVPQRLQVLADSRDGLYRLLIPVSLGLGLGGPIALQLWAPASFRPDGLKLVTLLVVVSAFGWCASQASMRMLLADGRSKATASAMLVAAALNLALNITLVPRFGIDASAGATLLSYLVLAAALGRLRSRTGALRPPPAALVAELGIATVAILASWYIPLSGDWRAVRLLLAGSCLTWGAIRLRETTGWDLLQRAQIGARREARRRAASPPDDCPPRLQLLYIAGEGRSGSTLLETHVSGLAGMLGVGEVVWIFELGLRPGAVCGCRQPVRDCPFWSQVGEIAFGGWDSEEAVRACRVVTAVTRNRHLLGAILGIGSVVRQAEVAVARIYHAIGQVSGEAVVVDSSKHPIWANLLSRCQDVDLHIVHLVRHPSAVAFSWQKHVPPAPDGQSPAMPEFSPFRTARRWILWNVLFGVMKSRARSNTTVRYEDYVADCDRALPALIDALGLADRDQMATIAGTTHGIGGNRSRFRPENAPIVRDDEWVYSLPARQHAVVSAMAMVVMARYGYRASRRHPYGRAVPIGPLSSGDLS